MACLPASRPSALARRKNDGLQRHPTRIRAELCSKRLRHSVDDAIGIDAASCSDLIDQGITVNHSLCEESAVGDLLFQPENGNVDVRESGVNQGFFDGVDLVIGEGTWWN